MKQSIRILFLILFFFFLIPIENIEAAILLQQENEIGVENGCISGDCENGFGSFVYENGDTYTGGWKNGKHHGLGTLKTANGVKKSGKWSNGQIAGSIVKNIEKSTWKKTGSLSYEIVNSESEILTNIQVLKNLGTDFLAVLDRDNRAVYLLKNYKNAEVGDTGSITLLQENVSKRFYISTSNSFAVYINDIFDSLKFSNINGSYIGYSETTKRSYILKNIRDYTNWVSKNLELLPYETNNTYWYRDVAKKAYGILVEGKTIDYTIVKPERKDDDLLVVENGVKKYALMDYYNASSFKFKPVTYYKDYSKAVSNRNKDCVSGNCYDGWGKVNFSNGYYEGFWKDGLKHGYGLYKWEKSGGKYIGNWERDKKSGYGVYLGGDGDDRVGTYKDGKMNGIGYKVVDKKWTQGIFKNGTIQTTYSFVSTGKKTGCTAGDCESKYGRYKWSNGDSFTGFFKNGKMNLGTYTFANGDKYTGMFNSKEQFHGTGRYFFKSGSYYGGEWLNGKKHGKGYYHDKDYNKQIGDWSYGELLKKI